ncbi:hypothetical protein MIMGU_mgv1a016963mg [Erythranthe guttata]|uniref:Uncharacterized protein n=1 Tax=Erythranthe guttata TaxID=4155 RepID=A0A022RZB9_ERYGU|nr:hypothetical protein MIMGU_mgv1a016963mg [Erythranthe guttata]
MSCALEGISETVKAVVAVRSSKHCLRVGSTTAGACCLACAFPGAECGGRDCATMSELLQAIGFLLRHRKNDPLSQFVWTNCDDYRVRLGGRAAQPVKYN